MSGSWLAEYEISYDKIETFRMMPMNIYNLQISPNLLSLWKQPKKTLFKPSIPILLKDDLENIQDNMCPHSPFLASGLQPELSHSISQVGV